MAHKLLTDIEVQGEGLFNGNLTLGTPSAFSKLVFDTSGYDIGEIEVGSYQAMSIDAQDGVFELMSDTSSQNHAIDGTMGGYVTLNFSGDKKLQTASTGINITGLLHVGSTSNSSSSTEEIRVQTATSGGYGGNAVLNLVTGEYGNSGVYFGENSTYTSQLAYIRWVDVSDTLEYNSNGTHVFKYSGSEIFRTSGTSIGMGVTSTPAAKLDVYDSGIAINARSAQSVGLKVQGGANGMDIAQFKNQMGTITNVIDTSGFFGIGETDPDTPLHIKSISVPKIKLETTQTSYATPGQIEAWNGASNTLHGYLTWGTNPGVTGCRLAFSNAGNTSWLEVGSNYVRNTIAGSVKSHINATGLGINNTNPQEDLDVTGTIKGDEYKGYLPAFQHGGFYHSSSSSSNTIYWIPTNYISETTSSQYYNNWVAPYSGRVRKIVMRYASGTTPTATSVAFKKSINGAGDLSTYTATITNAASTSMTAKRDFSPTDITFNEGDRVRIGFTTNGGTRLLYGFAYTIVFEYNKD